MRATPRQPLPQRITVPRNPHSLVSFVCEYVNSIVLCMFPFALICMFSLNCVRPHCFPDCSPTNPTTRGPADFSLKERLFSGLRLRIRRSFSHVGFPLKDLSISSVNLDPRWRPLLTTSAPAPPRLPGSPSSTPNSSPPRTTVEPPSSAPLGLRRTRSRPSTSSARPVSMSFA